MIQKIRRAWPEATPAEAGVALRRFLELPHATLELALAWFDRAPKEPRIDEARRPWRACVAQHRAGEWLAARARRAELEQLEQRELASTRPRAIKDRKSLSPPEELLERARSLGLLRRSR